MHNSRRLLFLPVHRRQHFWIRSTFADWKDAVPRISPTVRHSARFPVVHSSGLGSTTTDVVVVQVDDHDYRYRRPQPCQRCSWRPSPALTSILLTIRRSRKATFLRFLIARSFPREILARRQDVSRLVSSILFGFMKNNQVICWYF